MRDSAAHVAGLCAGDTIIAMDGLKATRTTLAKHLLRYAEGEPMSLHYFRQDELASTTLVVPPQTHDTASLAIEQSASSETSAARRGWLQTTLA
jgi:predicted metalloprotease with PDZ domain